MTCPKCQREGQNDVECPFCGVIFSKIRQAESITDLPIETATPELEPEAPPFTSTPAFRKLLMAAGALVISFLVYGQNQKRLDNKAVAQIVRTITTSKVKVYSVANDRTTLTAKEEMDLYGLDYEIVEVHDPKELKDLGIQDRLIKRGLASVDKMSLPVYEVADELFDRKQMNLALKKIQPMNFHPEKEEPYIVVYGVNNCAFTSQVTDDLKKREIPFEYRDLNSAPGVGVRAETRMYASGYDQPNFATPIIEVNGYIRPRMAITEIIQRYEKK